MIKLCRTITETQTGQCDSYTSNALTRTGKQLMTGPRRGPVGVWCPWKLSQWVCYMASGKQAPAVPWSCPFIFVLEKRNKSNSKIQEYLKALKLLPHYPLIATSISAQKYFSKIKAYVENPSSIKIKVPQHPEATIVHIICEYSLMFLFICSYSCNLWKGSFSISCPAFYSTEFMRDLSVLGNIKKHSF